jgi:hypothetical protein
MWCSQSASGSMTSIGRMNRRTRVAHEGWRALRHLVSSASYAWARRRGRPVPLTQIMNRQGSDKGSVHGYRGGLFVGHAFTDIYDRLFADLRERPITLLEVGIGPTEPGVRRASVLSSGQRGGSAAGWHEYFAHGDIHAMDILDCRDLDRERLTTHIGDQGSRESMAKVLASIGKALDIVIDDGSHQSRHQQLTLACLFPALADDGVYVIEDLDWQPDEPEDMPKTLDLLRQLEELGTFASPVLTDEERAELERRVIVESIHIGDERRPGVLAVLRKRH